MMTGFPRCPNRPSPALEPASARPSRRYQTIPCERKSWRHSFPSSIARPRPCNSTETRPDVGMELFSVTAQVILSDNFRVLGLFALSNPEAGRAGFVPLDGALDRFHAFPERHFVPPSFLAGRRLSESASRSECPSRAGYQESIRACVPDFRDGYPISCPLRRYMRYRSFASPN